jgi:hypothetical protein
VVWRRTGQIALVGKEFCLLTKWTRDQLLDKRTFIAEVPILRGSRKWLMEQLMDDQSVVEYFERFAAHAFGDSSSVLTTCVLVGPDGRHHPCSFCFTIKRDVFDIPMTSTTLQK